MNLLEDPSPRALEPSRAHFLLLSLSALLFTSCGHGGHHHTILVSGNQLASAFQTLSDYLDDPTVQRILRHMPRFAGSAPPDVTGTYEASGVITRTSIPGTRRGDPVTASFSFSAPSGSELDVVVIDPSVVDAGAASFIEGSGDFFTVYTAFKSVQSLDDGSTCEIHEINVYSGQRNPDGSLSNLFIGQGIVGLIGSCSILLVGDFQVSSNTAMK